MVIFTEMGAFTNASTQLAKWWGIGVWRGGLFYAILEMSVEPKQSYLTVTRRECIALLSELQADISASFSSLDVWGASLNGQ